MIPNISGNQTKGSEHGAIVVNAEEPSERLCPKTVSAEAKSEVQVSSSADNWMKTRLNSGKNMSSMSMKDCQPSIFSSSDCKILRPTPKHPSSSHDIGVNVKNQRMGVSKSTSSLSSTNTSQRMTRSRSAVNVEESVSNKLPEKRKLPQDSENLQKKIKSGRSKVLLL